MRAWVQIPLLTNVFFLLQKLFGSGGIRTHASEETGALNQRLRPLGHATNYDNLESFWTGLWNKKDLPPVRLELTAFRLWDWRAAYCATEACKKMSFKLYFVGPLFFWDNQLFPWIFKMYLWIKELCNNYFFKISMICKNNSTICFNRKSMRRPGIEPGSTAWKAAMLTTIPPTLLTNESHIKA